MIQKLALVIKPIVECTILWFISEVSDTRLQTGFSTHCVDGLLCIFMNYDNLVMGHISCLHQGADSLALTLICILLKVASSNNLSVFRRVYCHFSADATTEHYLPKH